MAFGCTITVNAGQIPSSQSNFAWVITEQNFIDANNEAAIDGGSNSILNGGGNLRVYTDDTKATQIPVQIVTFVTGGTPSVVVWLLSPTLAVGSTVYIEADTVATTQPPAGSTYGSEAVWSSRVAVLHMNEASTNGVFYDSTGNGYSTTKTSGGTLNTVTSGHPFNGTWPNFTQNQALTLTGSAQILNSSNFTISHWVNVDISSSADGAFGNRYSSDDTQWIQQNVSEKVSLKGATTEDSTAPADHSTGVTLLVHSVFNGSSLISYINGVEVSRDSSITNTSGITTPPGRDYRIATYYDDAVVRRLDGRLAYQQVSTDARSQDAITAEYNNQSNPSAFASTSAWEEQDAGITAVVAITTPAPIFAVGIAVTTPLLTAIVDIDISAPTFSVMATATTSANEAVANISIGAPEFSAIGSATLPMATASITLSLPAPIFRVTNIPVSYSAIFTGIVKSYEFTGIVKSNAFTGIINDKQTFTGIKKAASFLGVEK